MRYLVNKKAARRDAEAVLALYEVHGSCTRIHCAGIDASKPDRLVCWCPDINEVGGCVRVRLQYDGCESKSTEGFIIDREQKRVTIYDEAVFNMHISMIKS